MQKKYFTIEDLINYCKQEKKYNFSSKESGKPLYVQSIQDFYSANIEETDDNKLYAKVRVCHTLLNRNGSYITEDSMKEAMPSLKYSPLLANIHQLDDGSWDFHSHDYHIEEDENGNEVIVYDEKQVGTFTADEPYLEYDEDMDKTYVVARVAIPESYTRCADIIREKNGTKVSCELVVHECSYNAKSKYLQLDRFEFAGCTCLGCEKDGTPIGEGMLGSKITLEDFSEENNSMIKFSQQMIDFQDRLEKLESTCFNKSEQTIVQEKIKEGGNTTVEKDVNFEEEVTETEEVTTEEETTEEEVTTTETETESEETTVESSEEESVVTETESVEEEPGQEEKFEVMTRSFDISHEDLRYALYTLLEPIEESDNMWYWISNVYDDYFIYESYDDSKIYKQSYTKDNESDTVAFSGDRVELFRELLTANEKAELESMRANYAELVKFKETVEKNELHTQKEEIINSEKYAVIAEKNEDGDYTNKAFAELVSKMDDYSLADLETQIKVIHSDFVAEHATFDAKKQESKITAKQFNIPTIKEKRSRYGKLFEK